MDFKKMYQIIVSEYNEQVFGNDFDYKDIYGSLDENNNYSDLKENLDLLDFHLGKDEELKEFAENGSSLFYLDLTKEVEKLENKDEKTISVKRRI